MSVLVTKADGTVEAFKIEKLRRSLRRAGATKHEVSSITKQIVDSITSGMSTQEIYRRAFALLRERELPAAARYSLRRAMFGLGPTGFPFEAFLARMFEVEGYTTRLNVSIQGKCALHEIDVGAHKADHSFVAEAKFHSRPGIKSDLQVAMYSYARLLDLKEQKICEHDVCGIGEFMLVTNTKFTSSAVSYGECVGLTMLSWNHPRTNNLHDRIQRAQIYPITVLQNLSGNQAKLLLEKEVILCRDLLAKPQALKYLHINKDKSDAILSEAVNLVHSPKQ